MSARTAQRALGSVGARGRLVLAATSLIGLAGFTWPLLYGARRAGPDSAHAADAPWLFAILAALNSVLRLPGGVAGFNALWSIVIVSPPPHGPHVGSVHLSCTPCCCASG